jgi:hypothetical protein
MGGEYGSEAGVSVLDLHRRQWSADSPFPSLESAFSQAVVASGQRTLVLVVTRGPGADRS